LVRRAVSIYLQPDLLERIEAAAEADGRSLSNYVERALVAITPRMVGARVVVASNIPNDRSLETPGESSERIRDP
jgi:hypothetical protein